VRPFLLPPFTRKQILVPVPEYRNGDVFFKPSYVAFFHRIPEQQAYFNRSMRLVRRIPLPLRRYKYIPEGSSLALKWNVWSP
jgi:hypothetical protein